FRDLLTEYSGIICTFFKTNFRRKSQFVFSGPFELSFYCGGKSDVIFRRPLIDQRIRRKVFTEGKREVLLLFNDVLEIFSGDLKVTVAAARSKNKRSGKGKAEVGEDVSNCFF